MKSIEHIRDIPFTNNLLSNKILETTMIRKEWVTIIEVFGKSIDRNQIEASLGKLRTYGKAMEQVC